MSLLPVLPLLGREGNQRQPHKRCKDLMNTRLKAELWEVQLILYGILDVLLWDRVHWLAIVILMWIVITIIGILGLMIRAHLEEEMQKQPEAKKEPTC